MSDRSTSTLSNTERAQASFDSAKEQASAAFDSASVAASNLKDNIKDRISDTSSTGTIKSDQGVDPDSEESTLKNQNVHMSAGDFGVMDQSWNTKGGYVQAKYGESNDKLGGAIESGKEKASELSAMVGEKFEQAKDTLRSKTSSSTTTTTAESSGPSMSEKMTAAKDAALSKATAAKDDARSKLSTAEDHASSKLEETKQQASLKLADAKQQVSHKMDEASLKLHELKDQASAKMGELKEKGAQQFEHVKQSAGQANDRLKAKVSELQSSSSSTSSTETTAASSSPSSSSSGILATGQHLMSDLQSKAVDLSHKASDLLYAGAEQTTSALHSLGEKIGFSGESGQSAASKDLKEIAASVKNVTMDTQEPGVSTHTEVRSTTEVDDGGVVKRERMFKEFQDGELVDSKKETETDIQSEL